jgi:hypothetical protein
LAWTGPKGSGIVISGYGERGLSPTYSSAPVTSERPPWLEYLWEEFPQTSAFLYYAGFGLMDPKMPVELRTLGPTYVLANVIGMGAVMWWLDPADVREGGVMQTDFWERNIAPTQMPWEDPRYVWN